MMTFDRGFARLLLEICRFTYAAGFDDRLNAEDKQDALNWIKTVGGLLTDEPIILRGSKTSVACIAAYPDRNIVAYMGTKTQFNTFENAMASIKDWSENFEALLAPFKLTSEQLGTGHPQDINKDDLGGRVHHGFLEELAAVQGLVAEELLKRGGRSRPTYVTGHSQGGPRLGWQRARFSLGDSRSHPLIPSQRLVQAIRNSPNRFPLLSRFIALNSATTLSRMYRRPCSARKCRK